MYSQSPAALRVLKMADKEKELRLRDWLKDVIASCQKCTAICCREALFINDLNITHVRSKLFSKALVSVVHELRRLKFNKTPEASKADIDTALDAKSAHDLRAALVVIVKEIKYRLACVRTVRGHIESETLHIFGTVLNNVYKILAKVIQKGGIQCKPTIRAWLIIKVLEAESLPLSSSGLSKSVDPYVTISIDDTRMFRTPTIKKSSSPAWRETYRLDIDDSNEVLAFRVFDKRSMRTLFLGEKSIWLDVLREKKQVSGWFTLKQKKFGLRQTMKISGRPRLGTIKLSVEYKETCVLNEKFYKDLYRVCWADLTVAWLLDKMTTDSVDKRQAFTYFVASLHAHGKAVEFMKTLASVEIGRTDSAMVLFRGRSSFTLCLDALMRLLCHDLLKVTLQYHVRDACKVENSKPVVCKDQKKKTRDGKKLLKYVNDMWQSIVAYDHVMPSALREILRYVRDVTVKKWPNEPNIDTCVVTNLLFLRFYCPAIIEPSVHGISEERPVAAEKTLMLVSKVLMNLANLRKKMKTQEDDEFAKDFLTANVPEMKKYINKVLANQSEDPTPVMKVQNREIDFCGAMAGLQTMFFEHIDAIKKEPQSPQLQELQYHVAHIQRLLYFK